MGKHIYTILESFNNEGIFSDLPEYEDKEVEFKTIIDSFVLNQTVDTYFEFENDSDSDTDLNELTVGTIKGNIVEDVVNLEIIVYFKDNENGFGATFSIENESLEYLEYWKENFYDEYVYYNGKWS